MKFQAGRSGNPGGRPKALVDVQGLARKNTKEAIENLVFWMQQRGEPQTSLRASIALLEIGWGRPAQRTELTGSAGGPVVCRWQDEPTLAAILRSGGGK